MIVGYAYWLDTTNVITIFEFGVFDIYFFVL
jgi:hypothetical protein